MDIWEWVNRTERELRSSGQARLAELVDEVSSACCDGQHDRVEAIVPEALALSRALPHPWLEIFLRHWLLQSRVLHRRDVSRDTLSQAVALVELTGRPEGRECPQSVCAVQDLCSAYGLVDGVGYGEQRLAVTQEALERIDASWPCFDCVSSERASALRDLGRHQECLEFCDKQLAHKPRHPSGLQANRFRALSALGRHAEALEAANHISLAYAGQTGRTSKALCQSLALARTGDVAKAQTLLPAASQLEPQHFLNWLRAVRAIGTAPGSPNTWQIERTLHDMRAGLSQRASHFTLARLHKIAAELAVQRGSRFSAARHLGLAKRAGSELVVQDWLVPKLADVERALERLPLSAEPATLEQLLSELGKNPEEDLARLERGPWQHETRVVLARAAALRALGDHDAALGLLENAIETAPETAELLHALLRTLVDLGDHARLEELAKTAPSHAQSSVRWALARSHERRDEAASARACCEAVLAAEPEHAGARHLLALLLRDAGELERSLAELERLVQAHEPGNLDWDLMLVATLAKRWDLLRVSAKRLQLPSSDDSEGPIDEDWGPCRVRLSLADGREQTLFAWRRGPVTARIDEVTAPDEEQHHADFVVFDAAPLNQAELDEAEKSGAKQRPLKEYRVYRVLTPGSFRAFEIDGFSPNKEQREALSARLAEQGICWEQRSGTRYQLTDGAEKKPATFAFLGLPASCSERQAHETLQRAQQELGLRLTWPKLAEAAGDTTTAEEHRKLAAAWGIE